MKTKPILPINFEQLAFANRLRCEHSFHPVTDWSPSDWGNALAGEVGEACNFIKKLRRLDDGPDKPYNAGVSAEELKRKIGKELADVVIYADLLATRLGLALGEEVRAKFNEISQRVGSQISLPDTND